VAQSAHMQHKASTLAAGGSDIFLLDIVPPSPYHDVLHTRSQSSCDPRHTSVPPLSSDRDASAVLRPQPAHGNSSMVAPPTVPARRTMPPQSPPQSPHSSCSQPRVDVYYNGGVTNAAFVHPDPARLESTRPVYNRASTSGVHPMPSAVSNGVARSPAVVPCCPRPDVTDVDDARRFAAAGQTGIFSAAARV